MATDSKATVEIGAQAAVILAGAIPTGKGLRVYLRGNTADGFMYQVGIGSRMDGDHVVERNGVAVYLDAATAVRVYFVQIDYRPRTFIGDPTTGRWVGPRVLTCYSHAAVADGGMVTLRTELP